MPKFVAGEVIAVKSGGSEGNDDPLPIGDRRSRTEWIGLMRHLFFGINDFRAPKLLAISAIKTNQGAAAFFFHRLGEKDPISPNHRGGIAALRQGSAPTDILIGAPMERQRLFEANTS